MESEFLKLSIVFVGGWITGILACVLWARVRRKPRLGPASQRTQEEKSSKDFWDKFKITTEVTIALIALCWTVSSWWLVHFHEERSSERSARAAIDSANRQREVSAAQLAAALLPVLTQARSSERASALLILASVSPELANKISPTLESQTVTPAENEAAKKIVQHVHAVAEDAKKQQDLIQAVENGRVYQGLQLYGAADREFMRAAEMKASQFQIDPELIRKAKSAYEDGRFSEAARLFDQAFKDIGRQ